MTRPYPLRGLRKCASCGHSFVGTVSQGKEASHLSEGERKNVAIKGEFALRPYYICNGRNWHGKAFDDLGFPSGHIRAKELEALVWGEIESFLNNPESVIGELSSLLRGRLGEGVSESDLFRELEELRAEAAGKEGERNALYRLFRKGMLPETDLESQPSELREGESAIGSRLEKVKRTVEKSKDARSSLDGARATLKQQSVELIASAWRLERRQPELAKHLHPQ